MYVTLSLGGIRGASWQVAGREGVSGIEPTATLTASAFLHVFNF